MSDRPCTLNDVWVRPDVYYKIDKNGQPLPEQVNHGYEDVYFCNNCCDVSYSFEQAREHLEEVTA